MKLTSALIQPATEGASNLYHSYLVQIWRNPKGDTLHVALQYIQTGESTRFANLESLFAFLLTQNTQTTTEHNAEIEQ